MRLGPKDSENANSEMYVEATREVLKPVSLIWVAYLFLNEIFRSFTKRDGI